MSRVEELGAWPARVLWLALGLTAGPTFADVLDGRSRAVVVVSAALLWAGWAAGLGALFVPRSGALTVVRVILPAGVTAVGVAVGSGSGSGALDIAATVLAVLAAFAALAPWVADGFVQGSAYGPERRVPLRTPPVLGLVMVPLTWAAIVAAITVGPLLLAARRWVPGAIAVIVGAPLAYGAARALHQLARRFVVLVPGGLVIHDPLTMPEPQLFPRLTIERLGPARAGDAAGIGSDDSTIDLSGGAAGLALELVVKEPVDLLVRTGRGQSETRDAARVLFTPTRPAVVLDGARERRIPVG